NRDQASSADQPPPSVVLITLDTVHADHLACYGYCRIETPALDKLASEGIRFEHAYAQVPLTLPSHTVIMTGTYPMFNGLRDLTSTGLNTTLPTLAGNPAAERLHHGSVCQLVRLEFDVGTQPRL